MPIEQLIRQKLHERFALESLEIINDSASHAGHAGANETGETHFRIVLVSIDFEGLNRVARHRQVFDTLDDLLSGPVHALSITALTPSEDSSESG